MFRPTLKAFVHGEPEAILLVEFGEDEFENKRRLKELAAMMGDLGFGFDKTGAKWGGVVEVLDPALQAAIADVRTSGLNIMMSMKSEGKADLLRRGLRRAADVPCGLHLAPHRDLREARHARHLVRARLGRLPACAPGAQPPAGEGREGDARHRRGSLRDGARLQGLALRRARRRHRALGIPRVHVRQAAGEGLRGGEGQVRPEGPAQSRQDRARAEVR